ncbi:MAG: hypothetical protein ACRD5L_00580 [Bryobacteraceae bacterium]
MQVVEKFGRWFVVLAWTAAGAFCFLDVWKVLALTSASSATRMVAPEDVIYAACGVAFLAVAVGIARRARWARLLSLGLCAMFAYWDFNALVQFADARWFPVLGLVVLLAAWIWLRTAAARGASGQTA